MVKKKTAVSNTEKPTSKMDVVRQILSVNGNATPKQIAAEAKAKHDIVIDPKMAATYRYHIVSKSRRQQRKVVRAVQKKNPSALDSGHGVDDLLRAASKLGWQRINEIVQGVLNAPL
ncbi:MAG: hypothetical protein JWN70_757 [Planctomycetaceae bacterium]|nr:hypothetical protein [Planctomycetaceae bacterium]